MPICRRSLLAKPMVLSTYNELLPAANPAWSTRIVSLEFPSVGADDLWRSESSTLRSSNFLYPDPKSVIVTLDTTPVGFPPTTFSLTTRVAFAPVPDPPVKETSSYVPTA